MEDISTNTYSGESGTPIRNLDLKGLIASLHKVFSSNHINVEQVHNLMKAYVSNPEEWGKYAYFSSEGLTRNLVDSGNGKFNLILVCWEGGQQSTIHDHANCHCFMRQLQGALNEVRYTWPIDFTGNAPLTQLSSFRLNSSEVSYINDEIGLHRMENASKTDRAVSLHLYCPPFDTCAVFNEKSGQQVKCEVKFWTKYGKFDS